MLGGHARERGRGVEWALESERGTGRRLATFGMARASRERPGRQVAWRPCARAANACLSSSWRQEDDDWRCQSAGPACWPLGQAGLHREVSAGGFSSLFVSIFYFLTFVLI